MKNHSFFKRAVFLCSFLFFAALFIMPISKSWGFVITAQASELPEDPASKIKLNVRKKSLVKEDTYTIKVYNMTDGQKVTFKSDDSSVVSVKADKSDREAVVTGESVGKTTVTAIVKDGLKTVKSMTCDITVTPPAKTVKFVRPVITVKVGETINLKEETDVKPLSTAEVPVFTVENQDVVVLTSTSVTFKAKEEGQTTITAVIANGCSDVCTIIVIKEEEAAKDDPKSQATPSPAPASVKGR